MKRMIRSISALSVLTLAIAGCAPVPGIPTPQPTPTPGQSAQPTPTPTVSASPSEPLPTGAKATLRGKVYDEAGKPVDGARIRVKSLNPSAPYESLVDVLQGSYVSNQVPAGVLLEITAMKDGWTQRSRVETLTGTSADAEVNFGGGNAEFISDFPEIAAIEPAYDAEMAAGKFLYKLTLSEPLTELSKRRLETALRLVPANAAAAPGGTPAGLSAGEDVYGADQDLAAASYTIKKGSMFGEDSSKVAKITWSSDGLVASFEFDAPLQASQDGEAQYQVALLSEGAKIEDNAGKQLGTDANGSMTVYPASGKLIMGAFKAPALALKTIAGLTANSPEERWAATHLNAGRFKLAKDDVAAKLEGVSVVGFTDKTRIVLRFNEPMAAFNGTVAGYSDASLLDLSKYTFALGESTAALEGVKLDGTPEATVDATTVATYGASAERKQEFRFTNSGAVKAALSVNPLNAKEVFLTINTANFFSNEAAAIKARVAGLADPAGKAITSGDADAQVQTGAL